MTTVLFVNNVPNTLAGTVTTVAPYKINNTNHSGWEAVPRLQQAAAGRFFVDHNKYSCSQELIAEPTA